MITGFCIIRDQTIILNGKIIFQDDTRFNDFLLNAYGSLKIDYPKFYKMDNLSKLGFLAAEVLLKESQIGEYPPESVAVVLSNAHSSLDTDIRYAESAKTMGSPALFVYTLPNIVAGEICIRHGLKGENAFFVSPAFDEELMCGYIDALFLPRSGTPTQACMGGWVDVLGEHHDVFLYLMENKKSLVEHTPEKLKEIYNKEVWNN